MQTCELCASSAVSEQRKKNADYRIEKFRSEKTFAPENNNNFKIIDLAPLLQSTQFCKSPLFLGPHPLYFHFPTPVVKHPVAVYLRCFQSYGVSKRGFQMGGGGVSEGLNN